MFNRSKPQSNPGLFTGFAQRMQGNRLKTLNDKTGWHNLFRQHITTGIDEDLFSVLFSETMGRPNAPVRLLVGMMILKEGHGWSGARLFEESQFNILVMSALGLNNINDEIPAASTYYAFRKALLEYQLNEGRDLVGESDTGCVKGLIYRAFSYGVQQKRNTELPISFYCNNTFLCSSKPLPKKNTVILTQK